MSEAEMDAHTIRNMRDQGIADGQPPKQLVSLNPTDPLKAVIDKLFQNRCSVAPVLTWDTHGLSLILLLQSLLYIIEKLHHSSNIKAKIRSWSGLFARLAA